MDYSQAAYFPGSLPYPFMGMPPLTPSHSTSAPSEDFNNTSPPELYSEYTSTFEGYPPGFNHGLLEHHHSQHQQPASNVFHGPPTPPNNNNTLHAHAHAAQILNDGVILQQPPHLGAAGVLPKEEVLDEQPGSNNRRGDSQSAEEGDKLTPSQHKRKAQNRAAQRAFRERKERHVKELEAKLASMEAERQKTTTENEKLKRDLQKISTENQILRATTSLSSPNGSGGGGGGGQQPLMTGPQEYKPTDFFSTLLAGHDNKSLNHRIVVSESGERLYDASATWEYIINHDHYQNSRLDLADISNRLKGQAKCDGQGPVFEERAIREAIEYSMADGSDSLL